jgi:hypothetical protein
MDFADTFQPFVHQKTIFYYDHMTPILAFNLSVSRYRLSGKGWLLLLLLLAADETSLSPRPLTVARGAGLDDRRLLLIWKGGYLYASHLSFTLPLIVPFISGLVARDFSLATGCDRIDLASHCFSGVREPSRADFDPS